MIKINKEKTYLQQFDVQSKIQYNFSKKTKWIAWLLLCLLSAVILIVPQLPIIIIFGIVGVVLSLTTAVDIVAMSESSIVLLVLTLITTAASIGGYFIYVKFIERRPFYTIGLRQKRRLHKYLIGGLIAIGMQMTYFVIIIVSGFGEIAKEAIVSVNGLGFGAIGIVLFALIAFLVQGASEEVMVRGWLFPVLARNYSATVAIVVSSGLFMILHLANDHISIIPLVNLFLYGLFAVLYALNEGGLWGIFAFHSIWNWFMGNVIGLPVSGIIPGGASLIETSLVGPEFITGGNFGPEGGIIVSALLFAGIMLLTKSCFDKGILEYVDKEILDDLTARKEESDEIFKKVKLETVDLKVDSRIREKSNGEIEMEFN